MITNDVNPTCVAHLVLLVNTKYVNPPANPDPIPYRKLLLRQGMVLISLLKIITGFFCNMKFKHFNMNILK